MLKGRLPLVIAIVLGLLAGAFSWMTVERERSAVRKGWVLKPVVVASRDIPEGTILDMDMLQQRQIPEQFVTRSVVRPDKVQHIIGKKVIVQLQRGDPILWSNFESTKGFEKLSTIVQTRFRAINIPVGEIESVGGWVRPNDHVDVLVTYRNPETREMETITLLQNVVVIATGKITGTTNIQLVPENERDYKTVTLMLLPAEVEIAALAKEMGTLTLSLRNPQDGQLSAERTRATLKTLMTGERVKELGKQRQRMITIISGTETTSTRGAVGPAVPPPSMGGGQ